MRGTIKHIDEKATTPEYYKKIRLVDKNGRQTKHKRKEVSRYKVSGVAYEAFWLGQQSDKVVFINPRYDIVTKDGELTFLKVISKGPLSQYELEWWDQGESSSRWMYLFKKEKNQFLMQATHGVFGLKRKVLMRYFKDCPRLQELIKNKELKKAHQVVAFYNKECGN